MTFSHFSWLELGGDERAAEFFDKSYKSYVREPFKVRKSYKYVQAQKVYTKDMLNFRFGQRCNLAWEQ